MPQPNRDHERITCTVGELKALALRAVEVDRRSRARLSATPAAPAPASLLADPLPPGARRVSVEEALEIHRLRREQEDHAWAVYMAGIPGMPPAPPAPARLSAEDEAWRAFDAATFPDLARRP